MGLFNWLFGDEEIKYIEDEIRLERNKKLKAEINSVYGDPAFRNYCAHDVRNAMDLYPNDYWYAVPNIKEKINIIIKGDNDMNNNFKSTIYEGTSKKWANELYDHISNVVDHYDTLTKSGKLGMSKVFLRHSNNLYVVEVEYDIKKEETPEWFIANPGLFYKKGDTYTACINHEPLYPSEYRFATKCFSNVCDVYNLLNELFSLRDKFGYFTMYDLKKAAGMPMFYPSDGKFAWRDFDYNIMRNTHDNQFCLVINTTPEHMHL